jgi:nicotinate-nucleotide adenylyltransferase
VTEAPRAFGILGGTFDPVHLGHMALAREALSELDLDHLLFVPNADPPHKQGQDVTPASHRVAMVALAIEPEPGFRLSRLELERAGPSYAVETVAQLAELARSEGRPEPWFVMSAETLDEFSSWRQPERILQLCRLAVAPRPGSEPLDASWVRANHPGQEDRFTFLPGPELDIASTDIRERLAAGRPIAHLVPDAVGGYIEAHGLYRPGVA